MVGKVTAWLRQAQLLRKHYNIVDMVHILLVEEVATMRIDGGIMVNRYRTRGMYLYTGT